MVPWLLPQFFCNVHPLLKERKKKRLFLYLHSYFWCSVLHSTRVRVCQQGYVPKSAPRHINCIWAPGYKILPVEMHNF